MRLAALLVAVFVALACAQECLVPCVFPPHHWAAHPQHPAWQALANVSLCGGTSYDALTNKGTAQSDDAGHEAAAQMVAAQLNLAASRCPTGAPLSFWRVAMALAGGCVDSGVNASDVLQLAVWNAGHAEDGPCHCTNLECARYVAPQQVIDKETAAIEKLSSASVGFLVWAIVATVIAAVLAVVVIVLLLVRNGMPLRKLVSIGDDEPVDIDHMEPLARQVSL